MKIALRLTVLKDKRYVKTPHFQTHIAPNTSGTNEYYCTTGVGPGKRILLITECYADYSIVKIYVRLHATLSAI